MFSRFLFRATQVSTVCLLVSASALAQVYGGGGGSAGTGSAGGYTPPKGGYSSRTGVAIGAGAAAGVAIAYLALHNHGSIVGCMEAVDGGIRLTDEKGKQTYALVPGDTDLKPGERVALKGKKIKSESGKISFQVQTLRKDYGPCKQ